MKITLAIQMLREFAKRGKFVFTKYDLSTLFPNDNPKTLTESLNRLIKANLLKRACRGIYVNDHALCLDSYIIEHIAKTLRRGEYNYVSLETMLSEYGLISQIPIDRLTVMTTGREGIYKTPYGVIEFTHTKRSATDILKSIKKIAGRPLRVATQHTAVRDLKRVGRNMALLNQRVEDEQD